MALCLLWCAVSVLSAQNNGYKLPPADIVKMLDAEPTPQIIPSPRGNALVHVSYKLHPSIALVSRPILRLGGLRIDPALTAPQRLSERTGLKVQFMDGTMVPIQTPAGANIQFVRWSNNAEWIAFTVDVSNGVELWIANARTGSARAVPNLRINNILGFTLEWSGDNNALLVNAIAPSRGAAPVVSSIPTGPAIEQTSGKVAANVTYQDMLKNPTDERLFEYYAMSQLARVDVKTLGVQYIGEPALFDAVEQSPDEQFILVTRLTRPFSYRVPASLFARSIDILDRSGKLVKAMAQFGVSDNIPRQGVLTGVRNIRWQQLYPATLVWLEALDGGDPIAKVPFRDKVMKLSAPFTAQPQFVTNMKHRVQGMAWMAQKDMCMITEFDRDRRWRTTYMMDMNAPQNMKTMFDLSAQDAYNDPGTPMMDVRADGTSVILQDGDNIYLNGQGASDKGFFPTLDKFNVQTLKKERLFTCASDKFESIVGFAETGAKVPARTIALLRSESKTSPQNFFTLELSSGKRTALTNFTDPAPQLQAMSKELIKFRRADGVPLSGTLFLPPNYKPGTKLPVLIWAYPLEYSDAGTAGQVRTSPNTFTRLSGASPLWFATQGFAVLNDATMPIVGDPETMNNTFVEQITMNAKAAIDKLDSMGVIDRKKVVVSGHSYGAFMTANLLAHTGDLFAAGIARSGAYNRTLTPFGFQSERRSFWEATDVYMKVSPFMFANKIKKPLLMIHGEMDNNTGTFPIQSERMYQAIQGTGGTARLVMLPAESHGYAARESILHTIAEMLDWATTYTK